MNITWKKLFIAVAAVVVIIQLHVFFSYLDSKGIVAEGACWKHLILVSVISGGLLVMRSAGSSWHVKKKIFYEIIGILVLMECYFISFSMIATTYGKEFHKAVAYRNSEQLIAFEKIIGFKQLELAIQKLFIQILESPALMHTINLFYMAAHVPCTILCFVHSFIACLKLVKWDIGLNLTHKQYTHFRNAFGISHVLVCLTTWLVPLAPPRMFGKYGYVDTIVKYSAIDLAGPEERLGVNPYAAMPSLHFAYGSLVGAAYYMFGTKPWIRNCGIAYAATVLFVIVVTGNHYFMDAAVAALYNWIGWLLATKIPYSDTTPPKTTNQSELVNLV